MKKYTPLIAICCFMTGCTAPDTKVAMTAMNTTYRQLETIQKDLVIEAHQANLDRANADIRMATSDDEKTAALEKLHNADLKIAWLDKEWAKARYGLGGLVHRYIYAQQGALSVLASDVKKAWTADPPGDMKAGEEHEVETSPLPGNVLNE